MAPDLALLVQAAPDRLIGVDREGVPHLVWDLATLRIPAHDLPHLAAVIDSWCSEEEPPSLRRGYYRLTHGPEGGIQLWLRGISLLLSREDVRVLLQLVEAAAETLSLPLCRQPRTPFGLGYRRLSAAHPMPDSRN